MPDDTALVKIPLPIEFFIEVFHLFPRLISSVDVIDRC
uniref:Uncharacterized protein n=1 Tax=Methylophaga nitratireducenticrescens TaxID=754476 RepID=I1XJ82_METNJ